MLIDNQNRTVKMYKFSLLGAKNPHAQGFGGIVHHENGTVELVIGAGWDDYLENVEIYNFESGEWRYGAQITESRIRTGVSLPYANSFLAIGGIEHREEVLTNRVWFFNPVSYEFEALTPMKTPRCSFTAALIPRYMGKC